MDHIVNRMNQLTLSTQNNDILFIITQFHRLKQENVQLKQENVQLKQEHVQLKQENEFLNRENVQWVTNFVAPILIPTN